MRKIKADCFQKAPFQTVVLKTSKETHGQWGRNDQSFRGEVSVDVTSVPIYKGGGKNSL